MTDKTETLAEMQKKCFDITCKIDAGCDDLVYYWMVGGRDTASLQNKLKALAALYVDRIKARNDLINMQTKQAYDVVKKEQE